MRRNRLDRDDPPDPILPPASRVGEPAPAIRRSNRIAARSSSSSLSIPSEFLSADLVSYFAFFPFFNASPPVSLDSLEFNILLSVPHSISLPHKPSSFAVGAPSQVSPSVKWDLKKEPQSYAEACARPDAAAWHAAMAHKIASLKEMDAFVECNLPSGRKPLDLKWVYAQKTDTDGNNIPGKEKA